MSIIIFDFNLIVGANEKDLRILPICIIMGLVLSYLITRKIILKQKIVIKNKIDLLVLLFMCSTLLPCIFKTYCTFQGTVEFILKYFFVYSIYLVTRNTVDNKNKINIIIAATILGSLIIAILGLDIQNQQHLSWILNKLNLEYTESYALSSTFGYKNTLAIYFVFCIFLSINQIQNIGNKKIKILYGIYISFAIYILLQSLSRIVFVLFTLAIVLYFILYFLQNIIQNKKKIVKIMAIFGGIIVLLIIVVTQIGTKVSKPYELTDSTYQRNFNYRFEPNQEYTIKLEFENVQTLESHSRGVEIQILEINQYFNEKILTAKYIKNGTKTINLNFKTTENLYQIDMLILNGYNEKILIKKCYINGEEYPIDYKYVPYEIGKALTTYSFNDKSIKQRVDLWKDCIKIFKQHPIIGQGGNSWKILSRTVQEYPYGVKESHSYFFELLISYGIVGVVLYILLFIFINIKIIKEHKEIKYKLPILFGLNLVIIHSLCFDFNMSFLLIILLTFVYIANIMYDSNQEVQELKIVEYGILTFLNIILVILILANVAKYNITDKRTKKDIGFYEASYKYNYINECYRENYYFRHSLNEIQHLMEREPYFYPNDVYKMYWDFLLNNIENLHENEIIKYLEFINIKYKNVKNPTPMYIDTILSRTYIMEDAYIKLKNFNFDSQEIKNQIEELKKIINCEYEVNMRNIKDKERNGYSLIVIDKIVNEYEEIIKQISET